MASCAFVILHTRLHLRGLQTWIRPSTLPERVLPSIRRQTTPRMELASLAHLQDLCTSACFCTSSPTCVTLVMDTHHLSWEKTCNISTIYTNHSQETKKSVLRSSLSDLGFPKINLFVPKINKYQSFSSMGPLSLAPCQMLFKSSD